MKVEILISALKAEPEKLIEKMNITSDAVLINQCDSDDYYEIKADNGLIRVISCNERGIGLSRNRALQNATGDILLFSDDDIEYYEGYEEIVASEFEKHPEAGALFFNVDVCEARRTYFNEDYGRVHIWNGGRYPAYSIAVRKSEVDRTNVKYSLLFGGGAKYSCGEDSLFIKDCLKNGIKMYRTTALIGKEEPRDGGESTWFHGYNEKYFYDKGVLFKYLYGCLAYLMGIRFVISKRKAVCVNMKWSKALSCVFRGIFEANE